MNTTKQRIERRWTIHQTIAACILAVLCGCIVMASIELTYAIKEWLAS